jgi:hypothetical protein
MKLACLMSIDFVDLGHFVLSEPWITIFLLLSAHQDVAASLRHYYLHFKILFGSLSHFRLGVSIRKRRNKARGSGGEKFVLHMKA